MIDGNGETFIPPSCPALRTDDIEARLEGISVTPSDLYMTWMYDAADGRPHDFDSKQAPHQIQAYAWLTNRTRDPYAVAVRETYEFSSPEGQLLDQAAEDDNVEQKLGERYCERIKRCQGVLMRGGELVCQALNPEDFATELRNIYPEA